MSSGTCSSAPPKIVRNYLAERFNRPASQFGSWIKRSRGRNLAVWISIYSGEGVIVVEENETHYTVHCSTPSGASVELKKELSDAR